MCRLLLADDHQVVRDGMKMIVESREGFTTVGEAADGAELLEKALAVKPDVILSDLKMPGPSVIDNALKLKAALPDVKLIVLTAYDEQGDVSRAMQNQIDGYIMKDTPPDRILSTVEMVLNGFTCFQPQVEQLQETETLSFTPREKEVFACIVENYSNQEIAEKLFVSETTVKSHVRQVLKKTGQPNRSQAVLHVLKHNLIDFDQLREDAG
ncbi:response regulator transcription factor [Alkalicoccus luteus]|uniref:response regulator transcription factor n=1 Tax=Alkalicoccus luteus TaxID=1237094 RepID=UPI004034B261